MGARLLSSVGLSQSSCCERGHLRESAADEYQLEGDKDEKPRDLIAGGGVLRGDAHINFGRNIRHAAWPHIVHSGTR